jgi:hypothetical protein
VTIAWKLGIVGGVVATMAAGIAAVWLTEDARAFGVVIALVGLVVGVALAWQEWRTSHAPHGTDAGHHASAGDRIGKAA